MANTCKHQTLSITMKGVKSEFVCCVVCNTRRGRFVEACPVCYPKPLKTEKQK